MELNTVGARIKWAREQKGWTQEQLGERLGVDRTHVSKWETDQVAPRGAARLRIGRATGVSYEWLRTGEGPRELPELGAEGPPIEGSVMEIAPELVMRSRTRPTTAGFMRWVGTAAEVVTKLQKTRRIGLDEATEAWLITSLALLARTGQPPTVDAAARLLADRILGQKE